LVIRKAVQLDRCADSSAKRLSIFSAIQWNGLIKPAKVIGVTRTE
jgi:hypothetical protein